MEEALADVARHLPAQLIDASAHERLQQVAQRLPGGLSTFWGLECRLGDDAAQADVLYELKCGKNGQALLAGHLPSALDGPCSRYPVWSALRDFAADWSALAPPRKPRNLWLEFDVADAAGGDAFERAFARPNVFFGPDEQAAGDDVLQMAALFARAHGRPLAALAALSHFIAALPQGGRIFQVGLMLNRDGDDGLRLCVHQVSAAQLPGWLGRVLPAPVAGAVLAEVEPLAAFSQRLAFDFNVAPGGVDAAIGLECYLDWDCEDGAQWAPLLDQLVARGLCRERKREGLLAYPGKHFRASHDKQTGEFTPLLTHRRIHHIKVDLGAGGARQAKAYLAVSRPQLRFGGADDAGAANGAWVVQ